MTFNLYSASHKTWDHTGSITPNIEYCEAARPHGEFKVADWLPVQRYDTYYEDYFTVSAGKAVAFDREGRIVPAGYKKLFATGETTSLVYTATDVTQGVIDLTKGTVVTGAVTYTAAQVLAALIERGLLDTGDSAADFISFPIGVAPYNYYQWCGGDGTNPTGFRQHNYKMQGNIAILCKYVIEVPLVPISTGSVTLGSSTSVTDTQITEWNAGSNGARHSATSLAATIRYGASVGAAPKNPNVTGLNLPFINLAKNTTLTPFGGTTAALVREVSSIALLTTAGDYYVDYDVGMILFYTSGGLDVPAAAKSGTFTFYHYDAAPASVGTYACATGALKPGDFVTADSNSNFVKARVFAAADAAVAAYDPNAGADTADLVVLLNDVMGAQNEIIGQVIEVDTFPKDYLERVRTQYAGLGTVNQMPGSASAGLPASVTYAGAANKTVKILLLK